MAVYREFTARHSILCVHLINDISRELLKVIHWTNKAIIYTESVQNQTVRTLAIMKFPPSSNECQLQFSSLFADLLL